MVGWLSCRTGPGGEEGELWDELAREVERLTSSRPPGANPSEDFAVHEFCRALGILRKKRREGPQSAGAGSGNSAAGGAKPQGLVGLHGQLAHEERNLRIQQAKLAETRLEIERARSSRDEFQKELNQEIARRSEASASQTQHWREVTAKTHLCATSLNFKKQERALLQKALDGSANDLAEAEVDDARAEAASAKRELADLAARRAELDLAFGGTVAALTTPTTTATTTATTASSASFASFAAATAPAPVSSLQALARGGVGARLESTNSWQPADTPPTASPSATFADGQRGGGFGRDDILRIATKSSQDAKVMQAAMAGFGGFAGQGKASPFGGALPTSLASDLGLGSGGGALGGLGSFGASRLDDRLSPSTGGQAGARPYSSYDYLTRLGQAGSEKRSSILDEAKRVMDKIEIANASRNLVVAKATNGFSPLIYNGAGAIAFGGLPADRWLGPSPGQ